MIIVAIPAYNEEKNIGSLLERIEALGHNPQEYHVLVVNDGSTDNTVSVVRSYQERMPVTVLNHETNRGVGQVFRTAFATAMEMAGPGDIIVTMEADNTSDLAVLKEMVDRVEQGNDVVLASCYADEGGVEGSNLYRKLLSAVANGMLRYFYPIGVKTYSSFYRAYRADALRLAYVAYDGKLIEEDGFVCMVEALIKLHRLSLRITEVPMRLKMDLRQGKSRMKVVRTILGYLGFVARDALFRKKPTSAGSAAYQRALKRQALESHEWT